MFNEKLQVFFIGKYMMLIFNLIRKTIIGLNYHQKT